VRSPVRAEELLHDAVAFDPRGRDHPRLPAGHDALDRRLVDLPVGRDEALVGEEELGLVEERADERLAPPDHAAARRCADADVDELPVVRAAQRDDLLRPDLVVLAHLAVHDERRSSGRDAM
jgi:hypothetical protein